ncbi:MAG: hypothetical protein ABIA74_05560 [bacterium]
MSKKINYRIRVILMLLSGGYHEDSWQIISESIINLWNKDLIY